MNRKHPLGPSRSPRTAGFSLVEVTLALLVAAGGLLTIFGVFPVALRQSQMSRSDMGETSFADAVLQTLGGNIRRIDDISVWQNPAKFWAAAVKGTGLPATITDADNGSAAVYARHQEAVEQHRFTGRAEGKPGKKLSPMATYVASSYSNQNGDPENIWYVAYERFEKPDPRQTPLKEIVQPAQFLIRLAVIRRKARYATGTRNGNGSLPSSQIEADDVGKWADAQDSQLGAYLPNVYQISVVSTDRGFPDVFIREPVFSQEFTFIHRP